MASSSMSTESIPASATSGNESEQVSDDETAGSEASENVEQDSQSSQIVLSGAGKKCPLLIFRADVVYKRVAEVKAIGEKYHMAYKLIKTECKLLRTILNGHGFHEAHPNSNDFNLMWTGSHIKPYVLRALTEFQKVNHFPRSYEITRKDRLYKNIQRMQQTKGMKHFDFIPQSFITPAEFQDFCSEFMRNGGMWIVKPCAMARGKGIFLISDPDQVPLDETFIVAKYINNPLTIDGFKFDLRLYVAVTSYDPLCIYLYEEGLTRFATAKYDRNPRHMKNQCMHLTNYSVNKRSDSFVSNDDPNVEDYGNKWSLGAMLRYLRSEGHDTTALMMRIEDVLTKTIICAELPIATACKMFMPHKGNCFEVYGFDILIDSNMRPWILEVNLSPSLACDAPLDLKIKSHMLSDLFSLTGFPCHDPMMRPAKTPNKVPDPRLTSSKQRASRPSSASAPKKLGKIDVTGLSGEEVRMIRRVKEENRRRGGFVRIFPTRDSWELYGSFMQFTTNNNLLLHQRLFPENHSGDKTVVVNPRPTPKYHYSGKVQSNYTNVNAKIKSWTIHIHSAPYPTLTSGAGPELVPHQDVKCRKMEQYMRNAFSRSEQYERKLRIHGSTKPRARHSKNKPTSSGPQPKATFRGSLVQGVTSLPSNRPAEEEEHDVKPPPAPPAKPVKLTASKENDKQLPSATSASTPAAVSATSTGISAAGVAGGEKLVEVETDKPSMEAKVQKRPLSPKMDVVGCLNRGGTLSKIQARTAFAMYLSRVQSRLMTETNTSEFSDVESANEQMDLVLRFLKRAATNLQQSFKVVVPSRKLPLNDRRRILAKQLGDFVHIYSKETEQLNIRKQIEKKHIRGMDEEPTLDERRFSKFITIATETELEEVLTTYTKLNRSASIFLGSSARTVDVATGAPIVRAPSDTSLNRPKEEKVIKIPTRTEYEHTKATTEETWDAIGPRNTGNNPVAHAGSSPSLHQTASIYSQRMAGSTRQRPASAGSARSTTSGRPLSAHSTASRPNSSTMYREKPDGKSDVDDDEDLNNALQRIALRQKSRTYSATSRSSILVQGYPTTTGSTNAVLRAAPRAAADYDVRLAGGARSASSMQPTTSSRNMTDRWETASKRRSVSSRDSRLADATFNEFVATNQPSFQNDLVAAYNQVTGVVPMNAATYVPSRGSTQYQVMQRGQLDKQSLSEESRHQMELSKAKHQAMIAQVHAAQRQPEKHHQQFQPKPPSTSGGAKKPVSSHRLARTSLVDETAYNSGFYGTLQYDSSTGRAKPSM